MRSQTRLLSRLLRASAPLAVAALLASCGNETGQPQAQQVAASPPPAAVPPPVPAPPPVPPPPAAPAGPLVAGVAPGGVLVTLRACADGTVTAVTEADGSRRRTGISAITSVTLGTSVTYDLRIHYPAPDRYELDYGGWGESVFSAANKRQGPSRAHDYFRDGNSEFELYRNAAETHLSSATLGRLSEDDYFGPMCFYGAGPSAGFHLVDGDYAYRGIADGLLVNADGAERLFGSKVSVAMQANLREVRVTIDLAKRSNAFGEFLDSPAVSIGKATALLTYDSAIFSKAALTGPDGSTGTITGQLYGTGGGVGLVFELTYPNGDRAFGAVAADLDY